MKFIYVKNGKIYCYEKPVSDSSDPEDWITMNGSHVLLGNNGEIIGGAGGKLNGKEYTGTTKGRHSYALAKEIYERSNGLLAYTGEKSNDPEKPYVFIDPQYGKRNTATSPQKALEMLKLYEKEKRDKAKGKAETPREEIPW